MSNNEYIDTIRKRVVGIVSTLREPEDRWVAEYILHKWESWKKVTQRELAEAAPWIGPHVHFETKAAEKGFFDTTTRRVREIVRNLRVKHGMPILSDHDGYYFPWYPDQCRLMLTKMEREVYARARSSYETYREMQKIFGVSSEKMERFGKIVQADLFEKANGPKS